MNPCRGGGCQNSSSAVSLPQKMARSRFDEPFDLKSVPIPTHISLRRFWQVLILYGENNEGNNGFVRYTHGGGSLCI